MTMYNKQEYFKNMIGRTEDDKSGISAEEMDLMRQNTRIYEYLCRLEEAKQWCEDSGCTKTGSLDDFEEEMRKGVILADLARIFAPECVKKVFVADELQYRHTDNINYFLEGLASVAFPKVFLFETFDVYDKKNIPRVIYCLHALAHYLERLGKGARMKSLAGKVEFTEEEVLRKEMEITDLGVKLPVFADIKSEVDSNMRTRQAEDTLRTFCKYKIDDSGEQKRETCQKEVPREDLETTLRTKMRALVWERSFDDIIYQKKVSVHTLKRFLPFFFRQSEEMEKEKEIEQLHSEIIRKRKTVFDLEAYLEEIKIKVTLLTDNKVTLSNIVVTRPLSYAMSYLPMNTENYRTFQKVFYVLQNDPFYLFTVINILSDEELGDFVARIVLPLFSFVQGKREEFLVSKLVDFVLKNESPEKPVSKKIVMEIFRKSKEGMETEVALLSFVRQLGSDTAENVAEKAFCYARDLLPGAPLYLRKFFASLSEKELSGAFLDELIAPYFLSPELYDAGLLSLKKEAVGVLQLVRKRMEKSASLGSEVLGPVTDIPSARTRLGDLSTYADGKKSVLYLSTAECNNFLEVLLKGLEVDEKDPFQATLSTAVPFEHSEYLIPFYLNDPELLKKQSDENIALTNFINKTKQKILLVLSISEGRNLREMLCNTEKKEIALFEKHLPVFRDYELDNDSRDETNNDTESNLSQRYGAPGAECYSGLSQFKAVLLKDLAYLESKDVISSTEDILSMLAQDIITLKLMSEERSAELSLNRRTKCNLEKKIGYLNTKAKAYEEYLHSFAAKLVTKKRRTFFERNFAREEKESLYGSYKYSAQRLRAKGVLLKDFSHLGRAHFYFLCNDPLVLSVEVFAKERLLGSEDVRIDDLLKMRCYGTKATKICGLADFSVQGLIEFINEKYMD